MEEVRNKAGEVVDFSFGEDVSTLFLETVTDKVARSILFDTNVNKDVYDIDLDDYEIIKVMKRIINAAFTITFSRWKQLDDECKDPKKWPWKEEVDYFENSRFTKIFRSAIANEEITIDLQIFALIELWVSLQVKDAPRFVCDKFEMIFDKLSSSGYTIGLTLQSARDAIKNVSFISNDERGKYTPEYLNRLCYRLLNSFLVFREAKFTYPEDNRLNDDKDFSIEYTLFGERITIYPNICFGSDKLIVTYRQLCLLQGRGDAPVANLSLYLLSDVTSFGGKKQITYRSFDGESETRISVESRQDKQSVSAEDSDFREMRKFLSFSYKNIRELAIVISDAIKDNPTKRQELFSICQEKHSKIIADIKGPDAPNVYWDNIITLMLVEIGFSDFLEIILKDEVLFLNKIMQNIKLRYVGRTEADEYIEKYHRGVEELRKGFKNNDAAFDAACLELRVRTVLKSMNFDKEENWKISPFEESLSLKYENIRLCLDVLKRRNASWDEINTNRKTLIGIFKNIFDFLQVFYVGLDGYAERKMQLVNKPYPEDETEDEARRRVGHRRRQCSEKFIEDAQKRYNEVKKQSLRQSFEGFCELCGEYNSYANSGNYSISKKAKNLKYLITRNYICDVYKLRHFVAIQLENGEQSTIFDMLEDYSPKYSEDKNYEEWLTYFYDVFFFLIYNEDYNERGLWDEEKARAKGLSLKDKDCDPVYPYIVTYYKENIDRDNLKKCTYRVPMPTSGNEESPKQLVVTLLTEENYPPNTYYCIPLRYGSSDSWWINPFLIPKFVISNIKVEDKNESHNN